MWLSEATVGRSSIDPLALPGDHPVSSTLACSMTRFRVKKPRQTLACYRDYQRVLAATSRSDRLGLLRSVFLLESPTTWWSLSIWTHRDAIGFFGTDVPEHIVAARRAFGRLRFHEGRGPELWSAKWQLASISNNVLWDDWNVRELVEAAE